MLPLTPPLLLADFTDLIGILVGLGVLVAWVIRQILEANKQAAPPRGRPAGAPPQPQPQPQGRAQAGQQADPLRSQVEEFLRRAGRGPQGERPRPRPRPAGTSEIEVLVDDEMPAQRRPLAEPLRPVEASAAAPTPPQPAPVPRKARAPRTAAPAHRETVAEHVRETMEAHSQAVAEHTSRLGQRIIEDDHQFDVQLKAKFDHTVGTLTGSAVTAAEQAAAVVAADNTPAAHIADLLSNPDGVRQAIIVNEILRRPAERW